MNNRIPRFPGPSEPLGRGRFVTSRTTDRSRKNAHLRSVSMTCLRRGAPFLRTGRGKRVPPIRPALRNAGLPRLSSLHDQSLSVRISVIGGRSAWRGADGVAPPPRGHAFARTAHGTTPPAPQCGRPPPSTPCRSATSRLGAASVIRHDPCASSRRVPARAHLAASLTERVQGPGDH